MAHLFTAAQAAQKGSKPFISSGAAFTAAQAAQKLQEWAKEARQ